MSSSKLILLLSGVFLAISTTAFAQDDEEVENEQDQSRLDNYYVQTDDDYFNDKNKEQNRAFLDHEDPFPALPRNEWEVSPQIGGLIFNGTQPYFGFMLGASVRKALGYVGSLRGTYQFRSSNSEKLALSQHAIFFDGVVALNNVNYHKAEINTSVYAFGGPGIGFNTVKGTTPSTSSRLSEKFTDNYNAYFISTGLGFNTKFRRFSVGAELRYSYNVGADGNTTPLNVDPMVNYLTLGAHISIPIPSNNRVEALWWLNPLVYPYSELNIPKHQKTFKIRFKDGDEDGVVDDFDKEPNTRKGCSVNAVGITLDTDKDGVPDCDDLEPITPTKCQPVDEDGIGKCPEPVFTQSTFAPNYALDTTLPGFPELRKEKNQTTQGGITPSDRSMPTDLNNDCPTDAQGKMIDSDKDGVVDCYDLEVITPSYCFPVDKNGVGNCLPSNCCEGLKFKDPEKYDDYLKRIKEQEQKIDSLNKILGDDLNKLNDQLKSDNQGTIENDNGRIKISLRNDILFRSGSAAVKRGVFSILEEVARVLKNHPNYDVMVEGHTDNVPINTEQYKDNWELSSARALAVVRLLATKFGADPSRLLSVGRGEFVPVADNATEAGRSKNRRIEITLMPRKQY